MSTFFLKPMPKKSAISSEILITSSYFEKFSVDMIEMHALAPMRRFDIIIEKRGMKRKDAAGTVPGCRAGAGGEGSVASKSSVLKMFFLLPELSPFCERGGIA